MTTRTSLLLAALCLVAAPAARAAASGDCRSALVTVAVDWDHDHAPRAAGVVARVTYPGSVDVKGGPSGGSARDRAENLTGTSGGLFDAIPKANASGDGGVLSVGLVTRGIPPGNFVRLRFDCKPGTRPEAADFSCSAEVSDMSGLLDAPSCTTRVVLE